MTVNDLKSFLLSTPNRNWNAVMMTSAFQYKIAGDLEHLVFYNWTASDNKYARATIDSDWNVVDLVTNGNKNVSEMTYTAFANMLEMLSAKGHGSSYVVASSYALVRSVSMIGVLLGNTKHNPHYIVSADFEIAVRELCKMVNSTGTATLKAMLDTKYGGNKTSMDCIKWLDSIYIIGIWVVGKIESVHNLYPALNDVDTATWCDALFSKVDGYPVYVCKVEQSVMAAKFSTSVTDVIKTVAASVPK